MSESFVDKQFLDLLHETFKGKDIAAVTKKAEFVVVFLGSSVKLVSIKEKVCRLRIIKFMRRIPKDPMTNSYDWGLRSYQDDPDSDIGEARIYTTSSQKAQERHWIGPNTRNGNLDSLTN